MDKTQEALKEETLKWLERLKNDTKGTKANGGRAEAQIRNMNAYISDCTHFQEKGDWIRAFEAVVYAWGIFETLKRLDLLEK